MSRVKLVPILLLAGAAAAYPARAASLAQNHVHSIAIVPTNPSMLYMGGHYELARSTDGGKHWQTLSRQMMLSLALDPANSSHLLGISLQHGFLRSTDAGKHWQSIKGVPSGKVTGVTFDPSTHIAYAYGSVLYRSTDGGVHWSQLHLAQSISSLIAQHNVLYAATGNGLFVSNGGKHWSSVNALGPQPIIQVAGVGSTVYAVAPIGLFKTTNAGKSWSMLGAAPQGIEFIGVAPSDSREVIAEVSGQGFHATYDGGKTWHSADSGIHDTNFNASVVQVAPRNPKIVYTGSWGVHFYASQDAGRHWTRVATLIH